MTFQQSKLCQFFYDLLIFYGSFFMRFSTTNLYFFLMFKQQPQIKCLFKLNLIRHHFNKEKNNFYCILQKRPVITGSSTIQKFYKRKKKEINVNVFLKTISTALKEENRLQKSCCLFIIDAFIIQL